ncbi:hypothetical protein [Xenorhabdus stockiae]
MKGSCLSPKACLWLATFVPDEFVASLSPGNGPESTGPNYLST